MPREVRSLENRSPRYASRNRASKTFRGQGRIWKLAPSPSAGRFGAGFHV